ncbi:hypothetical protein ACEPPN_013658 [Leptodophora sp. 'Broadleaf-Isolate-01']
MSDGPSGARGEIFGEGVPAAFFPSGVSLGATWDRDILFKMGKLLAQEAKSKSASVILAPTICIHRHALGGRNFESFGEDPFVTGKLAVAHIQGVQSQGVGATLKHFVANDQETKRFHCNIVASQRALREVYLLPFQIAVREADPWCIMTAYNKVNGHHCDMSKQLQIDIARNEWGWDGVFVSDWGGTNSKVESINNGLDLEMPGPPSKRKFSEIEDDIASGVIESERINQSARRLLHLLEKTGRFDDSTDHGEICLNLPEQRLLLREAAAAGTVLLKNEGNALPILPSSGLKRIAILGANAKTIVAGGGGSSYIKAPYWTNIYDSLVEKFSKSSTHVVHEVGAKVNRYLPTPMLALTQNPESGKPGGLLEWYNTHDMTNGAVVAQTHVDDMYFMDFGNTPSAILQETNFAFKLTTILTPKTTGRHKLSLSSIGPAKLFVNGAEKVSQRGAFEDKANLFFTYGTDEKIVEMYMVGGTQYNVQIHCCSHDRQLRPEILHKMDPMEDKFQGFRLGFEEHNEDDLPSEAAAIAQTCDAAIVVVGRNKEWESEGSDIPIFELPGDQVRLIKETARVCKRTIVVVQAGTPVSMEEWIDDVQGVIYAWYQGQEMGNSLADVVCGDFNPCGKLPVTFPRRIQDCPAFSSFPGENCESVYSEDIFVGYKWFDLLGMPPLFPIGFGLSYTDFQTYSSTIDCTSFTGREILTMRTNVRNVGQTAGRYTVVAWTSQVSPSRLRRPVRQICGFAKSPSLEAGQECEVLVELDPHSFGVYDTELGCWVIDRNATFAILMGPTNLDTEVVGKIEVREEVRWLKGIGMDRQDSSM